MYKVFSISRGMKASLYIGFFIILILSCKKAELQPTNLPVMPQPKISDTLEHAKNYDTIPIIVSEPLHKKPITTCNHQDTLATTTYQPTDLKKISILALGDSYTIGQSVSESERYPAQLAALLRQDGFDIQDPKIIAKTGWTTDELIAAIKKDADTASYDIVFLLIGVNNQYRKYPVDQYKREFDILLTTAIKFARSNPKNVFVISIPDYGYTPFGQSQQAVISAELDNYNTINKNMAATAGTNYVYITDISRSSDTGLVANDQLHPSAKQYGLWMERIIKELKIYLH